MNVTQNTLHGLMAFNTNDQIVGRSLDLYGEYCEGTASLLSDLLEPGDTAVDAGAHVGPLTIPMAKKVTGTGKVLAFEPQRHLYYTLCGNIVLNNLENVVCLQNALGAVSERIEVPELNTNRPSNFGGMGLRREWPPGTFKVSVKLATIDEFRLPRLDLIKVAVEGMEREVLLGAEQTIRRCRPHLYIDSSDEENAFTILRLAQGYGYKLFFHTPPYYRENPTFTNTPVNVFGNMFATCLFGYPEEEECPVDLEKHGLRPVSEGRKVILSSNDRTTDGAIAQAKQGVVEGLVKLADVYAEEKYDADTAIQYLNQAIDVAKGRHGESYDPRLLLRACPILTRHRRYEEALRCVNHSYHLQPSPDAAYSKGVILGALDRPLEAIECYREVLKSDPESAEVHFNLAYDLLKTGQYEEGWKEYEWRFRRKVPTMREFMRQLSDRPSWDGSPLNGRRILLYMEQGAGDHIQMCRYAKLVADMGGEVMMAAFPGLVRIMRSVPGVRNVVEITPELKLKEDPGHELVCSMMSLPRILGTTIDTIPAPGRYLVPPSSGKFDDVWSERNDYSFKLGIAWCGSETHLNDFTRSIPLRLLRPLWDLEGVISYASIQKGPQQRLWPCGPVDLKDGTDNMPMIDVTDRFGDFADTAEFIDKLDAVVCVDTSVAHLAAALGKTVYLLLWKNSDWRWLTGKSTPWYPSVQIIRGETWEDAVSQVKTRLQDHYNYETACYD